LGNSFAMNCLERVQECSVLAWLRSPLDGFILALALPVSNHQKFHTGPILKPIISALV
jgi:hypothetical protein